MKFLIIFIATFIVLASPPLLARDGKLVFYNYHTGEIAELSYHKDKTKRPDAVKIKHIFRSRLDDKETDIDPRLIDLLGNIQDHFQADAIELISGYRSPELNRQLKENGVNVAEESKHLEGQAADIHIDEVTEEALADYVRSLRIGGVGYYPALDFVHVDTGDVRKWDLPDKRGRLLMAFRKGDKWQVLSDKDVYFLDEPVPFGLMNITRTAKIFDGSIKLELFRRGAWHEVRELNDCSGHKLESGKTCEGKVVWHNDDQFGKYRLIILGAHSNEFYRKRQ